MVYLTSAGRGPKALTAASWRTFPAALASTTSFDWLDMSGFLEIHLNEGLCGFQYCDTMIWNKK